MKRLKFRSGGLIALALAGALTAPAFPAVAGERQGVSQQLAAAVLALQRNPRFGQPLKPGDYFVLDGKLRPPAQHSGDWAVFAAGTAQRLTQIDSRQRWPFRGNVKVEMTRSGNVRVTELRAGGRATARLFSSGVDAAGRGIKSSRLRKLSFVPAHVSTHWRGRMWINRKAFGEAMRRGRATPGRPARAVRR